MKCTLSKYYLMIALTILAFTGTRAQESEMKIDSLTLDQAVNLALPVSSFASRRERESAIQCRRAHAVAIRVLSGDLRHSEHDAHRRSVRLQS